MKLEERPVARHPYDEALPALPKMNLTSNDIADVQRMDAKFTGEGVNVSPHLKWDPVPGAGSYVVSCFDPDAPPPSGFWHWCIVDIPADVTELPQGAGADDATLRAATGGAAFHVRNDNGNLGYNGPMPPAGDRVHRYAFAVHAVKPASLGVDQAQATNAPVHFMSLFNGLARGVITGTYQR